MIAPGPSSLAEFERARHRVRGLDRRNDAFAPAQQQHRVHRLGVGDRQVLGSAGVLEEGVLRADARVVETRGDGVRLDGLPVLVLQQVGVGTLERTRRTAGEGRGVSAGLDPVAGGLVSDEPHPGIVEERVEDPDCVGTPTDTGGYGVGQAPGSGADLRAGLESDDALEVAHEHRERVRARRGAEAVVGVVGVGHPVAQGLVDRVLEGLRPRRHRHHPRAEQAHPGDVESLARGVDCAHVDDAFEVEQRARGRGGDAVLTGAGLGDDAGLAHPLGKQRLPEHVVDLVRAGVVEILALEEQPCSPGVLAHPGRLEQRRGPAGVIPLQAVEFVEERRIHTRLLVLGGDLLDHRHQRLGDVSAAVDAEMALAVGFVTAAFGDARTRPGGQSRDVVSLDISVPASGRTGGRPR